MHTRGKVSPRHHVDVAADRCIDAFIDSFASPLDDTLPIDRWLQRLIEELENARTDLEQHLKRQTERSYAKNLERCIKRLEHVLAQLYEEQLHH